MDIEKIIKDSLKKVEDDYYLIRTTADPIVRERVFCYELYHQMRKIIEKIEVESGEPIAQKLHAEIDKSGHPNFSEGDQKNPDFVFHLPGSFKHNTLICEIKGKLSKSGMEKDLLTIMKFIKNYSYERGLYIFYGLSFDKVENKLLEVISEMDISEYEYTLKNINILSIESSKDSLKEINLEELYKNNFKMPDDIL